MRIIICTICLFMTLILFIAFVPIQDTSDKNFNPPKYTVGVVLKAMDSEHWLAVRSSMQKTAQAKNINLIILWADNESAYKEQNKIIIDLLNNHVDAILISPCNIYESSKYLKLAKEKNIPIFSLDERLDNIPYIGSDNYKIGALAGQYFSQNLPSGSQVAVIAGSKVQDAHIERSRGFTDYINNYTDLKIIKCLADDTKYRQATIQAEKLLQEYPHTKGIFVTSAIMALGTIEATDKISPHIQIVGVDTQNDAILAIKNHKIDAMISQDGHEVGTLAINVVADYLTHNKTINKTNYIENNIITLENADDYSMQEDF